MKKNALLLALLLLPHASKAEPVYVEYADGSAATVVSVFGSPQSGPDHPYAATIDSADARYQAFINPPSTAVNATYNSAMMAGLALSCAGGATVCTSGLAATYSISQTQQANLANVSLYIAVNGRFPGSLSALNLLTTAGTVVTVNTTAQWQEVATAIADYVAKLDAARLTGLGGGSPTWPAASATLN